MTIGIGGATIESELSRMKTMRDGIEPISTDEYRMRLEKAQRIMAERGISALYLDASTSSFYFTGVRLKPSERLHGVIVPAEGDIAYLCPAIEEEKTRAMLQLGSDIRTWEEHESPAQLVIATLRDVGYRQGVLAIDPATPFFTSNAIQRIDASFRLVDGSVITAACRMIKSQAEISLLQRAMDISLEVQKAVARILSEDITTTEVEAFIGEAHRRLGANFVPGDCIVLFGEATAYPHGVPYPQTLRRGDVVLVDMVADIEGYRSDLTRTYVFGSPTPRQREIWNLEKRAQAAAFGAARIGASCESVDEAARGIIEAAGLGPGYAVPGLPHRTGHGIGLDIHEDTYIVKGNKTPLEAGMCFSNEPMICIYGEFGVRLEDHIYITETGPRWFTPPSHSVDDPFGYDA
jgi:Xaa-Pro dipeptidase